MAIIDPIKRAEYNRLYRLMHHEEISVQKKAKRLADLEGARAKDKESYLRKDKDKKRASGKRSYQKNKKKNVEKKRLYHLENYPQTRTRQLTYAKAYKLTHADTLRAKRRERDAKNRDKINEKSRAFRAAHPEVHRAHNHARRARKRNASSNDLTARQWEEIKEAYGHRCVYCGRKMQRLTQDHITPLIQGGGHTASNIVPACQSCNSKKHDGAPLVPVQPLLLTVAPPKKRKTS